MKRVDELGISPAPWNVGSYADIVNVYDDSHMGLSFDDNYKIQDAKLIAAAPELYKYLYQALSLHCEADDFNCVNCPNGGSVCGFRLWKSALEKAGGEQ